MLRTAKVAIVGLIACLAFEAQAQTYSQDMRVAQIHQQMMARAAALKAAWVETHGTEATGMTAITSGTVLTPNVSATALPTQPSVSLKYRAPSGISSFEADFTSQTTGQVIELLYSTYLPNYTSNPITLSPITGFGGGPTLTAFNAPGQWNVTYLAINDGAGNYITYDAAEISKIFSGAPFFNYTNNVAPDMTPPTVSTGKIVTKTVSLTANTTFVANLNVADDLSGVDFIYVSYIGPNGSENEAYSDLSSATLSGSVPVFGFFESTTTPTGTWTINEVYILDQAGNLTFVTDPAAVKAIFGKTTFTVTQ